MIWAQPDEEAPVSCLCEVSGTGLIWRGTEHIPSSTLDDRDESKDVTS